MEPSAKGADIKISTQRRGGTVVVKVTNTVPAGHGQQGHGVALRNVEDRLKLLHDLQTAFRATMVGSSALGALSVVVGLWIARAQALPPGGTIVLVLVASVAATGLVRSGVGAARAQRFSRAAAAEHDAHKPLSTTS